MSSEQQFIEARQVAYFKAMQSGNISNILDLMSEDVKYSDISMFLPPP
jgi:hypothetical protein